MKKLIFILLFLTFAFSQTLLTNLISYWKYDEPSGNALDSHSSNNGTISGTVTQNQSGHINTAYLYGGGEVNFGTPASLNMAGWTVFSVSCWVYYDGSGANEHTIMSNWGTGGSGSSNVARILFRIEPSNDSIELNLTVEANTDVSIQFTGVSVTVNTWTHLVITFTTTKARLWINDSEASNDLNTGAAMDATSSVPLWVGDTDNTGTPGNDQFTGLIDEMGIWGKELTTIEITALYNGGAGLAYPFGAVEENSIFFGINF